MKIKDRYTGKILKEVDKSTLRGATLRGATLRGATLRGASLYGSDLRDADLRDANLYDADLRGADLRDADLYGANLYGADLCGEKLKSTPVFIYGLPWFVTITNEFLTIGCQTYKHNDWHEFDDEKINSMHINGIEFWHQWKGTLLSACAVQSSIK